MAKIGDLIQSFIMSNPQRASWFMSTISENFWFKKGRNKTLLNFHRAAVEVEAYRRFLREHGVDHSMIKNFIDFKKVPFTDKKNYILKDSFQEILSKKIARMYTVYMSSGSTGESLFWPRLAQNDKIVPKVTKLMYDYLYQTKKKTTLALINFALGTWVAGEMSADMSRIVAREKDHLLTIMTPGMNIEETLKIITNIGHNYQQIIILSYPQFVRNIIEEGIRRGIEWQRFTIKLFLGGEGFSEDWRIYMAEKIGGQKDILSVVNVFASAEMGLVSYETPLSILIRKFITQKKELAIELFGEESVPSLVQFFPVGRFFEVEKGEILITAWSGIPLIRYNTHDRGGIITYHKMVETFSRHKIDIIRELKKETGELRDIWQLPFLFVHGRSNAVTFYGIVIYVEYIKAALESPELIKSHTGRFKLKTAFDDKKEQILVISVELAKGIKADDSLEEKYQRTVVHILKQKSSEFNRLFEEIKDKTKPIINLLPYHDESFTSDGNLLKYKYI